MENTEPQPPQPLTGLVVLDTTTVIGGPIMAALLADFGARVIKVEQPGKGDDGRKLGKSGKSTYWKFMARNKECVTCNLSSKEGQALFKKMASRADVVLASFRPGSMEEWGLGYADLSALNPRLILLQLSGFGQTGPYSRRPGYGALAEAMSGLVYLTGEHDTKPYLPGAPVADPMAAGMGALAVLLALRQRDNGPQPGRGQAIDISLYDPLLYVMGSYITESSYSGVSPSRGDQLGKRILRDVAESRDGQWVVFSVISGALIAKVDKFLRARGGELRGNGEYSTSTPTELFVEVGAALKQWIKTVDRSTALADLEAAGIPVAPVYSVGDMFRDEHFNARGDFVTIQDEDLGELRMPRSPFKLSVGAATVRHTGRRLGADNRSVYQDWLGMSAEELRELAAKKVI